jgi:hypothetical protein
MPLVGSTIRHTLDFVEERDGVAILQTKKRVVQVSYDSRSCAFVFQWNILLGAGGQLPRRLADLLDQLKNLGFKIYAIRNFDSRDVVSAFPRGITPFNGIYVQQETQDDKALFRHCYNQMRGRSLIFFGGEELVFAVINERQEKDVFVSVETNPDIRDGTPSYLEEMLAMVLVVQAGKKIMSDLDINY